MDSELGIKTERFITKFQSFVGDNIPVLILIGLLTFLLFGK